MMKQFYFKQFSLAYIHRLIDRMLPGATPPSQRELGSNGNEEVLHIPQISKTGASPSDCLMSFPENSLEGSYSPAEM